jgi:DUF4097 and DUF4098 domain-containing protein YvlB
MLISPLAAGALLLALSATGSAAERAFDRTVAAEPGGSVEISNVSGKLTITGWDRAEVSVHGVLDSGVERVDVSTDKGRTAIRVVLPSMSFLDSDADLEVHVPKRSEVQATTVSADLATSQLLGPQRLKTVSGELHAELAAADFEAKSVSGDLHLRGNAQPADVRVSSVSGAITLDRGAGDVEAASVSGDVRLEVDPARGVRMHSTSGDLTFRGNLTDAATLEAETVSGEVTLRSHSQAGYEYEASSFSGDIANCLGGSAGSTSRHGPGTRLSGTTGDGKARLRAKSMSGDIRICDH